MKKVFAILLSLTLIFAGIPLGSAFVSAATSGTTGDCNWVLNGTKLTISGSGKMADYSYYPYGPWGTGITKVSIGDKVTSIGNYAFYGCTGLTGVEIPNSITSIGNCAFYGCAGLTNITIPNSVTSIGSYAFSGCTGFTSITVPNSVTSIGEYAFYGCTGLESITVNSENTKYYSENNCIIEKETKKLILGCKNSIIPNDVIIIGDYAFSGCTGLTSITMPNSVNKIGEQAFYGCAGLTSVEIPISVTSIGSYAFSYCTGLTSVTIGNNVTSIDLYVFAYCTGLTSITMPNSITNIGFYAFYNCTGLKKIFYRGTETEWGKINKPYAQIPSSAKIYYNYDCDINGHKGLVDNSTCTSDYNYDYICIACEERITGTIKAHHRLNEKNECEYCGFGHNTPGDIDGKEGITSDDAIYLLHNLFESEDYPVNQPVDFNGDGSLTSDDAIYLLHHIFEPEDYPLH